jgi:hypothetical protein
MACLWLEVENGQCSHEHQQLNPNGRNKVDLRRKVPVREAGGRCREDVASYESP